MPDKVMLAELSRIVFWWDYMANHESDVIAWQASKKDILGPIYVNRYTEVPDGNVRKYFIKSKGSDNVIKRKLSNLNSVSVFSNVSEGQSLWQKLKNSGKEKTVQYKCTSCKSVKSFQGIVVSPECCGWIMQRL